MYMEPDTEIQVSLEYDSNGVWCWSGRYHVRRTGTVNMPIRPRRCDHMRMRIEGRGEVRLFSIARVIEIGSSV